ncbi:porin [Planctobacterium marinum]|uniref:porin n=1 Tax=Planctobacterium marinum TaxID=1631968 RepID=UPI001E297824|nr:porin [Planctobacterium marinum]MCC2604707.1 putative porin [Planctobacterium marinum]
MKQYNTGMLKTGLLIAGSFASSTVFAEIQWNGFASVKASYASYDNIVVPINQLPDDNEFTFKNDSVFGLQARADLADGLTATIQMVAEGRNDFDLEARWAYLSYKLNDNFTINAGRMANPIFYQSEYELVGYAHDYGRLPKSVYFGYEFNVVEGISLDTQHLIGDFLLKTKTLYGTWDGDIFIGATGSELSASFDSLLSFRAEVSKDNWSLFSGVMSLTFDDEGGLIELQNGVGQGAAAAAIANGATEAQGQQLVNLLSYADKDGIYAYAGFNWSYQDVLVSYERTQVTLDDTAFPDVDGWYLSLGYRFNDLLLTVRKEKLDRDLELESFDFLGHPILEGAAQALHIATGGGLIDGYGVGMRYDFHPNAALKFDYFFGDDDRPLTLPLGEKGEFDVVTLGVDIVF